MQHYIDGNMDILLISETKLDSSFTNASFKMEGYHNPFCADRNQHGGGILLYIAENIVCKRLFLQNCPNDIEVIFVELRFNNEKWVLVGVYHPPNQLDEYFTNSMCQLLSELKYENIIVIGDFNMTESSPYMSYLKTDQSLSNLIKSPTCFKSLRKPTCIDHIWVTNKNRFKIHVLFKQVYRIGID